MRNIYCMAFFAKALGEPALNYAKDELINLAKKQLFEQLQEKLKDGDKGIDSLFVDLTNKLINSAFLKTILGAICIKPELVEKVKTELKERIGKIEFSEKLEEMKKTMPEMGEQIDALPEKLKEKLNILIDDVITCNATPAPVAVSAGGSKQRDRKQKRRQKTKKNSHKRSRGRKRHSRK